MFSVVERENVVDDDGAVRPHLDTGRFEPESRGVCVPARRIHHGVDDDRGGPSGRDQVGLERAIRTALDAGDIAAEPMSRPLRTQLLVQMLAHVQRRNHGGSGRRGTRAITAEPRPWKIPLNSAATYPPPTTSTRLGRSGSSSASFEVMQCSMPGIAGIVGQPPVATRMCVAV